MSRSVWPWVLAGVLSSACVDVPERQDALDAGPDGPAVAPVSDGRPPDAARPADAGPDAAGPPDGGDPDAAPVADAGSDAALPPRDDCLPPIDGPYTAELPCLTVRAIAEPETELVESAGLVVMGPRGPMLRINGGLDRAEMPAVGRTAGWLYDPIEDRWSPDPRPLPAPRWGHSMAEMANGEPVVAGGAAGLAADGTWAALGPVLFAHELDQQWLEGQVELDPPRSEGVLLRANSLTVAYVGGISSPRGEPSSAVDALLVPTTVVSNEGLQIGRHALSAISLSDESVLVVGGLNESGVAESRVERLGGPASAVRDLPDAPEPRAWAGAASLPDGALFVGGLAAEGAPPRPEAFRFETAINRFVPVDDLHLGRARPTVTAIGPADAGWRLVVGGAVDGAATPGIVELYDPRTDTFHAFRLPAPWDRHRAGHVAAALVDEDEDAPHSTVLVVGGYDPLRDRIDPRNTRPPLAFDLDVAHLRPAGPSDCLPIARAHGDRRPCLRLTRGPSIAGARYRASAIADSQAQLVLSGGRDPDTGEPMRRVETLALGDRRWRPAPDLNVGRFSHSSLIDGMVAPDRIIVAGGVSNVLEGDDEPQMLATDTVESLDADRAEWRIDMNRLEAPRMDHALLRTQAGAFISGGRTGTVGVLSSTIDVLTAGRVDVHEPPLSQGRARHVMCLLANDLIVAGGLVDDVVAPGIVSVPASGGELQHQLDDPDPRYDAACLGGAVGLQNAVDLFGGRPGRGDEPTDTWRRFVRDPDPRLIELPALTVRRSRMTISRIGQGEGDGAAWLIVGGELPGADRMVELVFPNADPDRVEIYAFELPEQVPIRTRHAAATRTWVRSMLGEIPIYDRDVVVMGGIDLDTLEALDEVSIFTYDAFVGGLGAGE